MLDKMREGSQGVAAKIVLVVIILSFALAGVSSYLGGGGPSVAVMVNDQEVSQGAVEQAYQNERARLQQQYGEQFDILASNPNFAQQLRAQATQTLISESLISQAISDMGLRVGDEQVKSAIREMTEFTVDGSFNNEQYLSVLRRASYTPAQFSAQLKQDLARRQLLQTLVGSEFVLPSEISLTERLQQQQRVAKILSVNAADFVNGIEINNDEIKSYYENNSQLFQYPEQVSVDYVLLDGTTLASQVKVNAADVEIYYDNHQSDYQRSERRKVAHILVQGDSDEAKQKAQTLLVELEKGADFAESAQNNSDDTLSAKNNGELDWFERGVMEPEFDAAAFSLSKTAPLSGLVKSAYGYHIIKLVDIEPSSTLPLADVQTQVEQTLQQERIAELYLDLQQQLSEVAFESPDNLDEAAEVVNGEVINSDFFTAQQAPEVLSDKAILQIAFNRDFREEGMNSEVIELSDNKAIVIRINEYKAASAQPIDEVSDSIKSQLIAEKSRLAAQAYTESVMAKLNAQESIDAVLAEKNIAFSSDLTFDRYNRDYDYQVVQKLFKLAKPANDQITRDWVSTSNGDFAVIELSAVVAAKTDDASSQVQTQIAQMLERSASESLYQSLIEQLKANADIKYPAAN